jgi:taurine dioxygenase
MQTTVLASDFAVRIDGADLSAPLDDETFDAVRDLWMQYKVAVIPNQTLEDGDLLAFARRLGPLFVHVQSQLVSPDHKEVMYMRNRGTKTPVKGELAWHSDQSYTPTPVFGTILYGIEVPDEGGETCFADLTSAYAGLPDDLRRRVDGLTAVYSPIKAGHNRRATMTAEERERIPDVSHPLVRTHPHLGTKALYLSPNHITTIGDMSLEESEAFLQELVAHATQPAHVYCHDWRPGDVIMWDNASVMHRRKDFSPDKARFLKRTGFHLPDELRIPF